MAAEPPEYDRLSLRANAVFSPSAPIDSLELLAGRFNQFKEIVTACARRGQHAVLYGERGVGKTSLVNVLQPLIERFSGAEGIPVVLVSCDANDTFASVWRKIFSNIAVSRDKQPMGFASEPETVTSALSDYLENGISPETVRRFLSPIVESRAMIIVVDEFDRMRRDQTGFFSDTIKLLSDRSVNATIIPVGVADSVDRLIDHHRSVERSLAQIRMPRMSMEEIDDIIVKRLTRALGMSIKDETLRRISRLSHGLPHYAHLLGLHVAQAALARESLEVAPADIVEAINGALNESQLSIRNLYSQATASPRTDSRFGQVLLASALAPNDSLGYFTAAAVRGPMSAIMKRPCDISSYSRHLNRFTSEARGPVLRKQGQKRRYRYRFINPLLQPYVTLKGIADGMVSESRISRLARNNGPGG